MKILLLYCAAFFSEAVALHINMVSKEEKDVFLKAVLWYKRDITDVEGGTEFS